MALAWAWALEVGTCSCSRQRERERERVKHKQQIWTRLGQRRAVMGIRPWISAPLPLSASLPPPSLPLPFPFPFPSFCRSIGRLLQYLICPPQTYNLRRAAQFESGDALCLDAGRCCPLLSAAVCCCLHSAAVCVRRCLSVSDIPLPSCYPPCPPPLPPLRSLLNQGDQHTSSPRLLAPPLLSVASSSLLSH